MSDLTNFKRVIVDMAGINLYVLIQRDHHVEGRLDFLCQHSVTKHYLIYYGFSLVNGGYYSMKDYGKLSNKELAHLKKIFIYT